jgi:nucleoside phosphorylase
MKNAHRNPLLICICGASPLEILWIKRGLNKRAEWREGSALYRFGTYLDQKVLLIQSGIGGKNIRRALRDLPLKYDIGLAINIGCTGSLVPYLRIAHINIPCKIKLDKQQGVNYMPQKEILVFARFTAISFRGGKAHFLPALTVKKALDREEKLALHRNDPELGCIDLESFYFARFFSEAHIPYLIVRAVSDTRDFSLPPVPYLSPFCWRRRTYMPKISKQLPNILRFHIALIQACWTNQRFINLLIRSIRKLEI